MLAKNVERKVNFSFSFKKSLKSICYPVEGNVAKSFCIAFFFFQLIWKAYGTCSNLANLLMSVI